VRDRLGFHFKAIGLSGFRVPAEKPDSPSADGFPGLSAPWPDISVPCPPVSAALAVGGREMSVRRLWIGNDLSVP
jgi:hypothetical protein